MQSKSNCHLPLLILSPSKNDPDGQTDTSWGHLDASQVPWFVIPAVFRQAHSSDLLGNALGAVICNGKMFYAIYGDEKLVC